MHMKMETDSVLGENITDNVESESSLQPINPLRLSLTTLSRKPQMLSKKWFPRDVMEIKQRRMVRLSTGATQSCMMLAMILTTVLYAVNAQLLLHHDTCVSRCYNATDYIYDCQCGWECEQHHNCCPDFFRLCRGGAVGIWVTQTDLNDIAQSLWDHDTNRVNDSLYKQEHPSHLQFNTKQRLIVPTDGRLDSLLSSPNSTYFDFIQLLDNYEANAWEQEHRPWRELSEENRLLTQASKTQVFVQLFGFLVVKGFIKRDWGALRVLINELWFEPYEILNGAHPSPKVTGFERVMVGEIQERGDTQHNISYEVVGFNNWVHFYMEEKAGSIGSVDLQHYQPGSDVKQSFQNPYIVAASFTWKDVDVKTASFFVGTSPEFEMALFTICAVARPNKTCSVTINNQHINIMTKVVQRNDKFSLYTARLAFHLAQ